MTNTKTTKRPIVDKDAKKKYHAKKRSPRGDETRELILEAALECFATRGFHGASMRDIGSVSGVPFGAINYHYGSKEELYFAAIELVFMKLSEARISLLQETLARTPAPTLEDILRALIIPTLELGQTAKGRLYLLLQLRPRIDAFDRANPFDSLVLQATAPIRHALANVMPGLPAAVLARAYRSLVHDISSVPVDRFYEKMTGEASIPKGKAFNELVDSLVNYHAAGFRALAQQAAGGSKDR